MRLAYVLTHPIQYQSPLIRHLVAAGLDLRVWYGSGHTGTAYHDQEFGRQVAWDVPLLGGYEHQFLSTKPEEPDSRTYERLLAEAVDAQGADALWVHGWYHPLTRAAWKLARERQLPLLLRGETHLNALRGGRLQRLAHRLLFSLRFRQPAAFLSVGSANQALYRAYGVPESKLFSMPYAVDNAFFQNRAREAKAEREGLRARLGLPPHAPVVLFCGKLIPKKGAETLIRAFAHAFKSPDVKPQLPGAAGLSTSTPHAPRPVLLIVGDGELRASLEALANDLVPGQVHFTGFKNQTELPAFYDLCDLFVIPSLFEPWGLVVNEVMNAGKAVLASDRVGAAADLVQPGLNGDVFPAQSIDRLSAQLTHWLHDPHRLQAAGQTSLERIQQWGFEEDLIGLKTALAFVARHRKP